MYRLVFQNRAAAREPLVVDLPSLVIGRHADCHVQIAEPGVSDHHATIERRANGYYVRSLNSSNGVAVNGDVVADRRLASGDELEIGLVHLRFEIVHGTGAERRRRRIDPLQVLAAATVLAVIVGEIVMVGSMFSGQRPRRVKLDAARGTQSDQSGTTAAGPSAPAAPTASGPPRSAEATVSAQPAEPPVLNRMIRIARVDRNDSGDNIGITIQTKAQVGERELDTAAIAICVQFATVDGAGMGVDWRKPIWLKIPAWENFSTKTFTVRFPGTAHELIGYVVRTYYHRVMQDIAAVPPALRPQAPVPLAGGTP